MGFGGRLDPGGLGERVLTEEKGYSGEAKRSDKDVDGGAGLSTTPAISPDTPGERRGKAGERPMPEPGAEYGVGPGVADKGFFHSALTGTGRGSRV